MEAVFSSSVTAIGFDSDLNDLEVKFKSGKTYLYADVPEAVFDNLMDSPSIGQFVNQQIKPVYNYSLVK